MKSGLIAAMAAFEAFAESGRNFPGRIIFAAVPAEEDSGLGTLAAIRGGWHADAAIIPEPTVTSDMPELVIAHAGAMSLRVAVPGKAAHASRRLDGESALDHFLTVYRTMREHEKAVNAVEEHPLMRVHGLPYAINVGTIHGGQWSSSVMDSIEAQVRVGVSLHETIDEAEARFREAILTGIADDPWLHDHPPVIQRLASGFGSAETSRDHPLVQALAESAEEEAPAAAGDRRRPLWLRHVCLGATRRRPHRALRPRRDLAAPTPPTSPSPWRRPITWPAPWCALSSGCSSRIPPPCEATLRPAAPAGMS
ncbi:MAG: M20/M25/M40 family metallo-hydrolase [Arhodomonas sp.]|nr:M20/M25/M40 family metallo-hydrolase [Arhodomonas sp.]